MENQIQENIDLINKFYQAFSNNDAETMGSCYHDEVEFNDPGFGTLHGERARNMWRLLVDRGKGAIQITHSQVSASKITGKAHWEANYIFSKSARKVHNVIDAKFEFKDGLIIKHHDDFDFWKWSSMALGLPGKLLGWTQFLRKKVQFQSNYMLDKYITMKNR